MDAVTSPPFEPCTELQARIADRTAKIGIVGMGYVGLPLALLFSEQGSTVTGFDIDPKKVKTLNSGGLCIVRITATEIHPTRDRGFSATAADAAIAGMASANHPIKARSSAEVTSAIIPKIRRREGNSCFLRVGLVSRHNRRWET